VKRLVAWLWAVVRWLAEPRLFWIASLVLLLALWVSFRPGTSEIQVRVSGLVLQCLGVSIVALDLYKTRRLFGQPSIVTTLKAWRSRFPRWGRREVTDADTVLVGLSAFAAVERFWSKVDPESSIEERVGVLTRRTEQLNEWLNVAEKTIHSLAREHTGALEREKQLRAEQDEKLQALLEAAETGGLHISFVGLVWLLFGILLSSLPGEIAQGFQ